jgi:hypothetical protein
MPRIIPHNYVGTVNAFQGVSFVDVSLGVVEIEGGLVLPDLVKPHLIPEAVCDGVAIQELEGVRHGIAIGSDKLTSYFHWGGSAVIC